VHPDVHLFPLHKIAPGNKRHRLGQHVKKVCSTKYGSLIKLNFDWMILSASKIYDYGLWYIHIRFKTDNYGETVWTDLLKHGIT